MTTDKIHVIDRYIEYNEADCEQGVEWLIKDILNEIETRLRIKLQSKPKKATVLLIYNAINEDGSYDIFGSRGQAGEQSQDRST